METNRKSLFLATFIDESSIDDFCDDLLVSYNISKKDIFIYQITPIKHMITYKIQLIENQFFNIKELLKNTIQINKKQTTFFTINALNKLIESINKDINGNINHSSIEINWSDYQNKVLLVENDRLNILPISRVFL